MSFKILWEQSTSTFEKPNWLEKVQFLCSTSAYNSPQDWRIMLMSVHVFPGCFCQHLAVMMASITLLLHTPLLNTLQAHHLDLQDSGGRCLPSSFTIIYVGISCSSSTLVKLKVREPNPAHLFILSHLREKFQCDCPLDSVPTLKSGLTEVDIFCQSLFYGTFPFL